MTPILRVECVAKSYGGRRVLSAASLRAVPGEFRVLFGRNGMGKSTLLKIAAGRIQPDGGSVHFFGETALSVRLPALAARGLFYLPDHDLLSPAFTVRQQLTMVQRQFPGGDILAAAERLGLTARLDQRPQTLSGGERRRAEFACALVRQPRCLLADEPYRGVSPLDADVLTAALQSLVSQGTAVVVTGHEVPTLLDAADHVTWCTDGTTYELGPPALARQHDMFRREYLGMAT